MTHFNRNYSTVQTSHFSIFCFKTFFCKWYWVIVLQGFWKSFRDSLWTVAHFQNSPCFFFFFEPLNPDLWIIPALKRDLIQGINQCCLHMTDNLPKNQFYRVSLDTPVTKRHIVFPFSFNWICKKCKISIVAPIRIPATCQKRVLCSVSLKDLKKQDKWRTQEDVA